MAERNFSLPGSDPASRELVPGETIGWRAWEISALGKILRLHSVTASAHWPAHDWVYAECNAPIKRTAFATGRGYVAKVTTYKATRLPERTCPFSSDDRPPGENCSCGLYAASTYEQLVNELHYGEYDNKTKKIIGEVAFAGKVIIGPQGYRGERARVHKLYVPHTDWKLGRALSRQYNVPYELARWIG